MIHTIKGKLYFILFNQRNQERLHGSSLGWMQGVLKKMKVREEWGKKSLQEWAKITGWARSRISGKQPVAQLGDVLTSHNQGSKILLKSYSKGFECQHEEFIPNLVEAGLQIKEKSSVCGCAGLPIPHTSGSLRILPCLSPETPYSTLRWITMIPSWENSGLPRNCHLRTQLTLLSNRNPGVGSAQLPQSPPWGGIFIFLILRYQRMTWISA